MELIEIENLNLESNELTVVFDGLFPEGFIVKSEFSYDTELLEHSKTLVEDSCEIVALANKQDLQGHMSADRVEDILHIPTFPMVAIDKNNRQRVVELINTLMSYVDARKRGDN